MLLRTLTIECTECEANFETDESQPDYDKWLEAETCPNCLKLCAEKI